MGYEQPHGECTVLGETVFLKIDRQSARRDHRLIFPATDGHQHSSVSQNFDEGLGGCGLDRVHAPRAVSIERGGVRFRSKQNPDRFRVADWSKL